MFGEERVRELLMANSDLGAEELAAALLESMQQWIGGKGEPDDDIAILVLDRI